MRNQIHREVSRLMTQMRRLCSLSINKRLSVVGCSLHEYAVLFRLSIDAEVPQHELAYDAAIDPAAASRLVRSMTRDGLVTADVDPGTNVSASSSSPPRAARSSARCHPWSMRRCSR
jgi:DNA-binding MarR family transcriptional regulator